MSSGYARVNQSHVDVEDPPPPQGHQDGLLRNGGTPYYRIKEMYASL